MTHVFGHEWGDSPIIFTSDAVTSENYWRITPRVTKNIVIHGNPYGILFLTYFSGAKTQRNRWKLPSIDRRVLVVYAGEIITSCKHLLWRHFLPIVLRTFLGESCVSCRRRQVDYYSSFNKRQSLVHVNATHKLNQCCVVNCKIKNKVERNVFQNTTMSTRQHQFVDIKMFHGLNVSSIERRLTCIGTGQK